jgi:hypothetical protein
MNALACKNILTRRANHRHYSNIWKNIELRSCEVMADRALSFRDAQSFKEWRSEHVSLKASPVQPSLHGDAASR